MTRKNRRLGKGLEALLGTTRVPEPEAGVRQVSLDDITPNRFQPRSDFSEDRLRELADSIRVHGVVQPVIVRSQDDEYELVAGERRWRAAKIAGLDSIPAIIREFEDRELMEVALVENLQREDLNPMEQATAYHSLQQEVGLTQAEVAERIGVSRSQVANILRLMHLPEEVQAMVRRGELGLGHCKVVLGLDAEQRVPLARMVVARGLTVRASEEAAAKLRQEVQEPEDADSVEEPPDDSGEGDVEVFVRDVESRLERALGTRVSMRDREGRGRIVVEYYDYDDLQRLLDIMLRG